MLDAKYVIYGHYLKQCSFTDENITGKDNSLVAVVFFTEKHAHSFNKLQKIMHTCDRTSYNNTAKLILKKRQNI